MTYKSSEREIVLSLINIGDKKDHLVLAQLDAKEFKEDKKVAVYKGNCETTKCKKIFFKEVGGTLRNIVTHSGYYGKYYKVMLSGDNTAESVSFDKKATKSINKKMIYKKYLSFSGRSEKGTFSSKKMDVLNYKAISEFADKCSSKIKINNNLSNFKKNKADHLIGMGSVFIKAVSSFCADADYKEELTKIKSVELLFSKTNKKPVLHGNIKLTIYLSLNTFNPKAEAKVWVNSL